MKIFLALIISLVSGLSFGATCTSLSRNNYSTNQILTSSALNADFNQIVTGHNAFDAGCVTSGSLESDALNSTQFQPLLKGVKEGCKVSYSSATQISIGKCLAAVNGNFVYTSVATTASFGCTNCSAEVASTTYYVYIATGSTATTLTPLILTTAPNEDGYDNSGNKVLARFYNNSSSDIDQYSIDQWIGNRFVPTNTAPVAYTPSIGSGVGTAASVVFKWYRRDNFLHVYGTFTSGTTAAASVAISMPTGLVMDTALISINNTNGNAGMDVGDAEQVGANTTVNIVTAPASTTTSVYVTGLINSGGTTLTPTSAANGVWNSSAITFVKFSVPIVGWGN